MKFKSPEDIKRLRSLKFYLEKKHLSPYWKDIILKKLRAIFIIPSGMDSDPIDAYRMIGQQVIRIDLIEEVATIISEQCSISYYCKEWARELYELWKHSHELKENAIILVRALRQRGISDGFYTPEKDMEREVSMSHIDEFKTIAGY